MKYKIGDEVKAKATGLKCIINKFETNIRKEDVVVLIGDEGTLKLERKYFENNFNILKNKCKEEKSTMKFELDIDTSIMVKYARHLGFEENELHSIAEDEYFKDTIVDLIEKAIDMAMG